MKRSELKEYVMQTLLEVVDYPVKVEGKFIKKTLGYTGIQRDIVVEGTISDATKYAVDNKLKFVNSDDSNFGGHYEMEDAIYEFHPNPEYYGEMMELNMSTRDALSRISGTNDQILSETDTTQVATLVQNILSDETLAESRVRPIFSNITNRMLEGIVDPNQITRLLGILVKEGVKTLLDGEVELTEDESKLAIEQLYIQLKKDIEESASECSECTADDTASKPNFFKGAGFLNGGILAENYNRMVSDHRQFL